MKGLLLKDLYMTVKYCKPYIFIVILFTILSGYTNQVFMHVYPLVFVSMIPFTLGAYDERSKWYVYCDTLPVSRKSVVSGRYVLTLIFIAATLVLNVISYVISNFISEPMDVRSYLSIVAMMLLVSLVNTSVILPIYFKYGTEKARIMYMVAVGASTAITMGASVGMSDDLLAVDPFMWTLIGFALYAISWVVSIILYSKKEL